MPSIEWNKQLWGKKYAWPAHGDEWSYSFGSASAHWFAFILPRLHRYLPDIAAAESRIVEIAPGHGRWTQFLLNHCKTLAAYDVSEECISYCASRFRNRVNDGTAEFCLTDGLNIAEKDENVDLVYSFDSLVHVERDVMRSYLIHISRCLRPGRFAFLQHSNLGSYPHLHNYSDAGSFNGRGVTVSSATVQADAKEQGLTTLIQERLNHETQRMNNELVDCISVIQKPAHQQGAMDTVILNNPYYSTMGKITEDFVLPYEKCCVKC
jgi:ubiquinone/menaquinone biosynthesis C-methylase UbiE